MGLKRQGFFVLLKGYWSSTRTCLGFSFRFAFRISLALVTLGITLSMVPYIRADAMRYLINSIEGLNTENLFSTPVLMAVLFFTLTVILPEVLNVLYGYVNRVWKFDLSEKLELLILQKRVEIDIAQYEDPDFQNLMQRAFHKGHSPLMDFSDQQYMMLRMLISLVVGAILAISIHPLAFVVLLLASVPGLFVQLRVGTEVWNIRYGDSPQQRRFLDLKRYFSSVFAIIETKLFQTTPKLLDWIQRILGNFYSKNKGAHKKKVLLTFLVEGVFFLGYIGCIYMVLMEYVGTTQLVGDLVFALGVFNSTKFSIYTLFANITKQYEEHLSVKDILEFLNTESTVKSGTADFELSEAPEVVFDQVWFKYPSSEKWIIKGVSFTIGKGQMVALTGANGSGKSTILKLLCKIYDPSRGKIYVDGIDLSTVDQAKWWSYLGIMTQDFQHYSFLVNEAIAIGDISTELDAVKVEKSARLSTADRFIEKWQTRYDTQLGVMFGGKELSKGQRQKMALAKVLYRDSFFTILDEPTASIDIYSTRKIAENLAEIRENKTMILVSHDPEITQKCDLIYQLSAGSVSVVEGEQ